MFYAFNVTWNILVFWVFLRLPSHRWMTLTELFHNTVFFLSVWFCFMKWWGNRKLVPLYFPWWLAWCFRNNRVSRFLLDWRENHPCLGHGLDSCFLLPLSFIARWERSHVGVKLNRLCSREGKTQSICGVVPFLFHSKTCHCYFSYACHSNPLNNLPWE